MDQIYVMKRALKHGLTENQVLQAWRNHIGVIARIERSDGGVDRKTIGFSDDGRAIEITAREKGFDFLIYHANTPPTPRALRELGLQRRKR